MAERPKLLSLNDCAEDAQVSTRTIRRMIKDGDLKAVRIGKQIRIKEADWLAYMNRI